MKRYRPKIMHSCKSTSITPMPGISRPCFTAPSHPDQKRACERRVFSRLSDETRIDDDGIASHLRKIESSCYGHKRKSIV